MRGKILSMLRKSEGQFVSGQSICDSLGVSRTAVWKQIGQLKDDGYEIDSVPRKGYRMTASPDRLTEEEISPKLTTKGIGRHFIYIETVDSTNNLAKAEARKGCPHGTVVAAEHQTGGRGRSGRTWASTYGDAMQMSIVLRPDSEPERASAITQIGAAAVALALESMGFSPAIKWPNDVLLSGKKVCGILTEMSCELDKIDFIVMGIGVNANNPEFPPEISDLATSLFLEGNRRHIDRRDLMAIILNLFEPLYRDFATGDTSTSTDVCRRLSWLKGKSVSFEKDGEIVEAVAGDIDERGRLEIFRPDGTKETVFSGEVHIGMGRTR